MPPLQRFSNNPFRTKADFAEATEALLFPLVPFFSKAKCRIKVPVATGTHFDGTAAQVEGFSRPLWAVAALLSDPDKDEKGEISGHPTSSRQALLQHWVDGLPNGVDPASPEYWGPMHDWDQRMVESEIISYALLAAPESFYAPLSAEAKHNLSAWLQTLNHKWMAPNNWRWFRVLTNLALIKVCGEPKDKLWPLIEDELVFLEKQYVGEGWSADGAWRPLTADPKEEGAGESANQGRTMDYYAGSFAIQFSQLLYSKYAADLDPERCARFRERARQYIRSFWAYSDVDGAPIAFGRSLTYRFAMGAFYAAFASAGLCTDDDNVFTSHGAVKGMLLRHLRWWAAHSDGLFWPDGTLNIGFLYPNQFMCEDYNSPQSPYWALKALIVVSLPSAGKFWMAEEGGHPLQVSATTPDIAPIKTVRPTRQLLCNHPKGNHHFLLSSGQFVVWPMKAAQAKYSKFAYSSAFGFSVPTGPLLHQMAPDNALALSPDGGETWTVRWTSIGDTVFGQVKVRSSNSSSSSSSRSTESVPMLVNYWRPWKSRDVEVETTLIAPSVRYPDWHVRVHRIRTTGPRGLAPDASFDAAEAGFANNASRQVDGRFLWRYLVKGPVGMTLADAQVETEGALETPNACIVVSPSVGATGVVDVSPPRNVSLLEETTGELLRTDPNTNLLRPQTTLAAIRHKRQEWPAVGEEVVIATAVFAVSFHGGRQGAGVVDAADLQTRWSSVPKVVFGPDGELSIE